MQNKRISLDSDDFQALVFGDVVEQDGVKIILKDIGFREMINCVTNAIHMRGYKQGRNGD